MKIKEIFEELKAIKICKNGYEFSESYMGMNKSYYSVLIATNTEPSLSTLVTIREAVKIQASHINDSKHQVLAVTKAKLLDLGFRLEAEIEFKARQKLSS